MQPELITAVLAGLGGMLGWGFADFLAKTAIDRVGGEAALLWSQAAGTVPLALAAACLPPPAGLSTRDLAAVAVLGAWSGLSYVPTYAAFGKGKVSVLSPIFASYAVVVAVLSAALLGEPVPPARWPAFAVVFAGVAMAAGDPREVWTLLARRRRSSSVADARGVREILLAVCLYSVWLVALDRFLHGRPWVAFLLGIRVFSALALFAFMRARGRPMGVADRRLWPRLALVGCLDVGAFAAVAAGFSRTPHAGVVAVLSGAFPLPAIVLGRLVLKERPPALQAAGGLVIVAGVVLVYLL